VYFVDNVDLVVSFARRKRDLVAQIAHVVHAGMRGPRRFRSSPESDLRDRYAGPALIAGPPLRVALQAVDRFRQQAGRRSFAGPAWAAEQVSVPDAILAQRVAQRACDMLLADHIFKGLGSPLEIECCAGNVSLRGITIMRLV